MSSPANTNFPLPAEQEAILAKCFHPSGTFIEFPMEDVEISIPARFEKIVRMYPDRIALEMDDERVTYALLNRATNRLANVIRSNSDDGETPIAVMLPRGVSQCVAIFSVLKAGKILLLLDPKTPAVDLAHFLADSQAKMIITSKDHESGLRNWENKGVRLIDIDAWNSQVSDQNPRVRITPDSGAYIKYTSGSTGQAKGAIIPHRSLLHDVMMDTNSLHFCSHDRLVQVSGNYISRPFFLNLLNGATLCPLDMQKVGLHEFAPWLIKHEITIYRAFPSGFRSLVSLLSGRERFPCLRLIRLAGEPLHRNDVELFKKHFSPDCLLSNSYSSTETGIICSYYVDRSTEIIGHHVPVGYPTKGKEVGIVDDEGNELPPNQPGEIVVKSRFLSAGYWQRGDETRRNFQSSVENAESRIYRTGDIGQLSADGCLTHLGRKDDRVKIRNFRVDLTEVEAVLVEHPGVKLASVTAKEDSSGDTSLIAYYVPRNEPGPTVTGLREFLGAKLPPYMVPSVFVALDELPLTGTGKVNRRALPDPGKSRPNLATPLVEPTTAIERQLAAIWTEVLSLDQVGIHDSFFDLGGHSLAASRVISRVIQTFQLELPIKALFEAPTVAEMADVITQNQDKRATDSELGQTLHQVVAMTDEEALPALKNRGGETNSGMDGKDPNNCLASVSPAKRAFLDLNLRQGLAGVAANMKIPRRAHRDSALLSFAQQRLWFLNQLEPESIAYNETSALRIDGRLDAGALQRALNAIVERHEVLRTTYVLAIDGIAAQRIAAVTEVDAPVIDFSERPERERNDAVQRRALELKARPFDLSRDMPMRIEVLRLSAHEHVLIVVKHHIASDGWSSGVFARELAALYDAYSQGQPNPLTELPIQYADYAEWQRTWLQGELLRTQLAFWKEQLRDVAILELPTDRPRSQARSEQGGRQVLQLSQTLSDQLKTLSQREGATLYITLLTAFQILLHRYSGQVDIIVGSPIAGRTRIETEGLIGFFVNTLLLRTDLSGDPTFAELLGRVRKTALGAYEHQDLPYEKLIEEINPDRGASDSPMLRASFALQNTPKQALKMARLTVTPIEIDALAAKFDLTAAFVERDNRYAIRMEYRKDLFDATTIERMLGHFQTLLEGIVADPNTRIGALPLLSEAEKRQLLVEWNHTERDYPLDKCVHQLFEEQVERSPDAVAVMFEAQQLTYRELNRQANQLAHYLRELGVRPEALVGICMEPSLELIVGLLGILKAGGAYVPLDPTYPKERLGFMLEHSRVAVLLAQKELLSRFGEIPNPKSKIQNTIVVCLDREGKEIASQSDENPDRQVTGENLAYVIHTSGSTGSPKGVLVNHANVVRLFTATASQFQFTHTDVWTLFHSVAFDFSVWEIWGALAYGGRLVVVPYAVSRSPDAFFELLCEQRVTVLNQTPSAFGQLIEVEALLPSPKQLSLRVVIFGGEVLELQTLKPWLERHGDRSPRLVNMYGITETTVHVTYRALAAADLDKDTAGSVGRPIADLLLYVLDPYLQPVPIGVPGEIYVGGAGVARGYVNRPELTAERFLPNPYSDEPGARLYRTGDLARFRPDGEIEYFGRVDNQVKVRGYRIELGEIEAVLNRHPGVRRAVVISRKRGLGDDRLLAYVVPSKERACTSSELRSLLKQTLPEYMVPSRIVFINFLPLTPSGKVDRRALPAPDHDRPDLGGVFVAPRTPTEKILAGICAEVLLVKQIGVHDNFFDFGGHSLLATRVVSRVRDALHVELPLRSFFEHPTVEELAVIIAQRQAQKAEAEELATILGRIESLSDADVQRRLAREMPKRQV